MMKMTYDKDGYVIDAAVVSDGVTKNKLYDNADFGNLVDPDDFNVYSIQWTTGGIGEADLTIAGRTLYGSQADRGLRAGSEAPVFVVWEETYTGGESSAVVYKSYKDLETAVKAMKVDTDNFDGWVSAVLADNGNAEYIVIKCTDAVSVSTDGGATMGAGKANFNKVALDADGNVNFYKDNVQVQNTESHDWVVELVVLSTGNTVVMESGTGYVWGQPNPWAALTSGSSYRVTIDGVVSNVATMN